jgi:hypothetical protein
LRRSARISKKEGQGDGMPVGTASGNPNGNPCDNALEEFNLTEKTKEFSFGDINYVRQTNFSIRNQLRMLQLLRAQRSIHKDE